MHQSGAPVGVLHIWPCPTRTRPSRNTTQDQIGEVVELVKEYAKQETLGPIKGAGRWLAAGAAGAVMIGTGCMFLVLGVLRLVQNEFGRTFRGRWMSLLPYLFAFLVSLVVMGVAAWRISKKKSLAEREPMMAQRQRITRDDLELRFRQLKRTCRAASKTRRDVGHGRHGRRRRTAVDLLHARRPPRQEEVHCRRDPSGLTRDWQDPPTVRASALTFCGTPSAGALQRPVRWEPRLDGCRRLGVGAAVDEKDPRAKPAGRRHGGSRARPRPLPAVDRAIDRAERRAIRRAR